MPPCPPADRPPSPWGPVRALRVLLLVDALLAGVVAALALRLSDALAAVDPDAVVGDNRSQEALRTFLGATSAFGLVLVATGVLFVAWLWRLARTNQALGRPGALGPGWAIGSWFVPVASLALPAVVVHQVWKGADPSLGRDDPAWRRKPGSGRVWVWWAAYVAGQVLAFVGLRLVTATEDAGEVTVAGLVDRLDEVRTGLGLAAAGGSLLVVAAGLAAGLVVALTRRQEIAASVLGVRRPGAEPWTQRSAPAAWRDDPTGRHQLRWWDGDAWTDHVADDGRPGHDPVDGATSGRAGPGSR